MQKRRATRKPCSSNNVRVPAIIEAKVRALAVEESHAHGRMIEPAQIRTECIELGYELKKAGINLDLLRRAMRDGDVLRRIA